MKKMVLILVLTSGLASIQAHADSIVAPDSNMYAQFGISRVRTEDSGITVIHPVAIAALGYNFDKNFAGEVVAGTSTSDDTTYYGAARITSSIDSIFGAYLKAKTEVAPGLEIFARAGVLHANISASASNGFASASASAGGTSFSYGAGVQFNFTKTVYGQFDYMSFYNKSGTSSQGPSASIGFNF